MDKIEKIVPVTEQKKDRLYEMELKFSLDVELKEINDIMSSFGFQEKAGLKDVIEVSMKQVVNFIPDEETIAKYEKTIQENYFKKDTELSCSNCRFKGYSYLYQIEQVSSEG